MKAEHADLGYLALRVAMLHQLKGHLQETLRVVALREPQKPEVCTIEEAASFAAKLQEHRAVEGRLEQLISEVDNEVKQVLRELGQAAVRAGVPMGFTVSLPAVLDDKDVLLKLGKQGEYVSVDVCVPLRSLAWGQFEAEEVLG